MLDTEENAKIIDFGLSKTITIHGGRLLEAQCESLRYVGPKLEFL